MKSWTRSVVGVLFLLTAVSAVGAQDAPVVLEPIQPHPEGDAAIKKLRSPYCPGLMLEVCPTATAKVLRDTLQAMAHAGAPSDSIVAWMLAQYGEEYRAVPRARGSGLLAWIVPPLALVGGFVLVLMALKHFRSKEEESSLPPRSLSAEEESILAEALQELKATEEVPF
jgi:cytochrome c-type biogenesis protein CcmH